MRATSRRTPKVFHNEECAPKVLCDGDDGPRAEGARSGGVTSDERREPILAWPHYVRSLAGLVAVSLGVAGGLDLEAGRHPSPAGLEGRGRSWRRSMIYFITCGLSDGLTFPR